MAAFNLTAEINLRGPSNLNQVVSNIRRQLSTVSLNLNINQATSGAIRSLTGDVRNLSVALRDAQNNAAALAAAINNIGARGSNIGNITNTINAGFNQANTQARNAQNAIGGARSEMEEFGRQSALAIRRFAAFSVATGGIYALINAISSASSEFINFNKEFVRLQQVTESSASSLKPLADEITRLSTSLGVTSSDLLNVSTTLAQAGLSAGETRVALEALAKSALAPSFDDLGSTVEGSIAILRQFGLGAKDLEGALGSINAVAARFAVEASDIITAVQRTGGVFAAASRGVSQGKDALNEFIAVFTSVRATTRESAETIATGLRTIFTRIQRGATIEALKGFGIELTDLEGKFVGPYEAVRRLSEGLKTLDPRDLRFSQIVEELGGFRQIGKVIPLIQQFATAQQALGVAQRGSGSLAADAAKAQEALSVKITRVREEFIALIRDIGQSQSFQTFADISLKLASGLIAVASAAKEALPAITAILALRGIGSLGQYISGFSGGISRGGGRRFATGGLVPGSGSRDTVSAMLTPGEFVIRKKAVQAIGVNNLKNMNRYAKGGIVVDPSKIGAFFLSPTEGSDRSPVNIGGEALIKNLSALKQLGKAPKVPDARSQAFSLATSDIQSKILGFSTGKNRKKIDTSKLIKNGKFVDTREARNALFDAGYSREEIQTYDPNRAQKRVSVGLKKDKLLVSGQEIPISGAISSYYPGKNDLQASGVSSTVTENTRKGLYNTVLKSIDPILNSLSNPIISVNRSQAQKGAKRIADDKNAQLTTSGFVFEGVVQAITGAKLAGDQSSFDFPNIASSRESLAKMFTDKSGEGINSLIKADAKRTATPDAIDSIKRKIINDINSGKFEGVTFNRFARGGNVDSVPALLTPGEFVINKKAASRIGQAKLHQLNKADKISGFNTGGAVGHIQEFAGGGGVQRFFIGGIVTAFNRLLPVVTRLTSSLTGLSSGLSRFGVPRTGAGTARQGGVRAGTRNFTNQGSQVPGGRQGGTLELAGLLFAFQGLTSYIEGPLGSALSNFGSAATLAFSVIPGPLPFKLLVAGIAGVTAGVKGWNDALKQQQLEKQQKQLETSASGLDKSFERLQDATDRKQDTKPIMGEILSGVKSAAQAEETIRRTKQNDAMVTNIGAALGYQVDTKALSSELAGIGKTSAAGIQKYINQALTQGLSLDQIQQQIEGLGAGTLEQVKRSFAVAEGGAAVTQKMAEITSRKSAGKDTKQQETELQDLIDKTWQEFTNAANEQVQAEKKRIEVQKASQQAALEAANAITIFNMALKNVSEAVSRASAEFSNNSRLLDINLGSRLGDTLSIQKPDRLNENILSNLGAYSNQEISDAIKNLGDKVGFDPEFSKRLEATALSMRTLETSLPQILSRAGALQKGGSFEADQEAIKDEIRNSLKGLGDVDVEQIVNDTMSAIQDKRISTQETSLSEIANSSQTLQKILQAYNDQLKTAEQAQKAYNDMLAEVNTRMNQYVDALGRATDYQIKASDIRLNSEVQLREALKQEVSLMDMNAAFNQSIAKLTDVSAPNGQKLGATGDPIEIARRQDMLEAEKARIEKRRDQFAVNSPQWNQLNASLVKTTNEARNLAKAQEKLASDTTRASNAMSKIQSINQAREGARGQLFDVFKNINNPQWVQSFINSVGSYTRVLSGRGNLADLGPAIDALERRLQTLQPADADREREAFARQAAEVVARATGAGAGEAQNIVNQLLKLGGFGEDGALNQAIKEFRDANETAAKANEQIAARTKEGADYLYNKVIQAADDWVASVGKAGTLNIGGDANVAGGLNVGGGGRGIANAGGNRRGGVIYANDGALINFKPKGSDTVPAMLTPGEFVVNKKAAKNNIGLLKSINSGSSVYSNGGVVYARTGGSIMSDIRDTNSRLQKNIFIPSASFDVKDAIAQTFDFNSLLIELGNKIKDTKGLHDDSMWYSLLGAKPGELPYWANRNVSKMKLREFLNLKEYYRNFVDKTNNSALLSLIDVNNGYSAPNLPIEQPVAPTVELDPEQVKIFNEYLDFKKANIGARDAKVKLAASSFREYLKYNNIQNVDPAKFEPDTLPKPPEVPEKIPPAPKYYDELTYKEYLDKIISQGFSPVPPERGRFTTDAFYTKTKLGTGEVENEEDVMARLYTKYGDAYEQHVKNIKNKTFPERAIRDFPYRDKLIAGAASFGDFLKSEESLKLHGLDIADIVKENKAREEATVTGARVTQFDTRLVGPINGGPIGDVDINQIKQTATTLQEKTNEALKNVNEYAALITSNGNKDAVNISLSKVSSNYEQAIDALDQLSNLTIFRKNNKIHIPDNNDNNIDVQNIVNKLKSIKLTYDKPENKFKADDFSDATLMAFDAKYAQLFTQNPPVEGADKVPGKTTVAGMTETQKNNIYGRKSAASQYKDSLAYYIRERGKYNYSRRLKANRDAALNNKVGRYQTGGMVYASDGSLINFQPRGTDTVPAMLTPGEFVVNAKATKQNLGLLHAINNSNKSGTSYFSKGGFVPWKQKTFNPNYPGLDREELVKILEFKKESEARNKTEPVNNDTIIGLRSGYSINLKTDGSTHLKIPTEQELDSLDQERQNPYYNKAGTISQYGAPPDAGLLDAPFYERLLVAQQILNDIGEAFVAKGLSLPKTPVPVNMRLTRSQRKAQAAALARTRPYVQGTMPGVGIPGPYTLNPKIGPRFGGLKEQRDDAIFQLRKKIFDDAEKELNSPAYSGSERLKKDDPLTKKQIEDARDRKLENADLLYDQQQNYFASRQRSKDNFTLTSPDIKLPIDAVGAYDELLTEVKTLSAERLKALIERSELLGQGANSAAWSLTDNLALYLDKSTIPSSLSNLDLSIDPITGDRASFESQFGGRIARVSENGAWVGAIVGRVKGLSASNKKKFGRSESSTALEDTQALDLLSTLQGYSSDVFAQLFRDQLALAEKGYITGLSDSKLTNFVFGTNRIVPVDIGGPDFQTQPTFPTGKAFVETPASGYKDLILSDKWLSIMKNSMFGTHGLEQFGLMELLRKNPRMFLERLEGFKFFDYENDPRANSPEMLGQVAMEQYSKIKKIIEDRMAEGQKIAKQNSDQPPQLKNNPNTRLIEQNLQGQNIETDNPANIALPSFSIEDLRQRLSKYIAPQAKATPPQTIKDMFGRTIKLMNLDTEFDPVKLNQQLDKQITTDGIAITLAEMAKLIGVPLERIIPKDVVTVLEQQSKIKEGGSWSESIKSMRLAVPGDNLSDIGATGRIVFHEGAHAMLHRFGNDTYARYQDMISKRRNDIIQYMIKNSELFTGYPASTIDNGLQYILREIAGYGSTMGMRDLYKWGSLNKYLSSGTPLPLDANQIKQLQEYYKQRDQYETRASRQGENPPPPYPPVFDFEDLPDIFGGDLDRVGRIIPSSWTGQRAKGIFDIARLALYPDKGPTLPAVKAQYDALKTAGIVKSSYDQLLGMAREEFLTQMMQSVDMLDSIGVQLLGDILNQTLNSSNSRIFDVNAFYKRVKDLQDSRRAINTPPPLPRSGPPPLTAQRKGPPPLPVQRRQYGGLIYANNGRMIPFESRGTDTVPAMLTPGEFVVNAKATKQNLGLLKAINSGSSVGSKSYQKGGIIYAAGGIVVPDSVPDIDWIAIESLNSQLLAFANPDKGAKKHRQDPTKGPYPLIQKIGKALKTVPVGTDAPAGLVSSINELNNLKGEQIAAFSFDRFKTIIQSVGSTIGYARKYHAAKREAARIEAVKPKLVGSIDTTQSTAPSPTTETKSQPVAPITPEYYDELTYKEYLWKTIKDSWDKIKSGQGFSGPVPPDKSRFITPAFYYKKTGENQVTPEQKEKIEKAKGMAEEWKKEYEQWRQETEKRKAEIEKAGRKYVPDDERENTWLDNIPLWVAQYRGADGLTEEEIKKVFADAKISTSSNFRARATAFDVRNTSGIVGGGQKIDPKDVNQERVKAASTALLTEIANAERLRAEYKTEESKQGTDPALIKRSKEIFGESYTDAVDFLKELAKEQTIRSTGGTTFTTAEGAGAQTFNINTAVSRLKMLRDSYKSDILSAGIVKDGFSDSILDEFKVKPEVANPGGARDDMPRPSQAPIVKQTPPSPKAFKSKPVQGKVIRDSMSEEEKKSINGRKGIYSQYMDSIAHYKVMRGKFNYEYKLYRNKEASLSAKQGRRDAALSEQQQRRQAAGFASGGVVYAQNGSLINFQPRGTDTVPAMLTPGEFVVNRKATKNNLSLLQAINDNKMPYMASGGMVQRFQGGGMAEMSGGGAGGVSNISLDTSGLDSAFNKFSQYVESLRSVVDSFISGGQSLSGAINNLNGISTASQGLSAAASILRGSTEGLTSSISTFNTAIQNFEKSISNIPQSIGLQVTGSIPVTVSVTVNGGEGIAEELQQFKTQIYSDITRAINDATNGRLRVNLTAT
jgi:TP901 family phage tail tape measure protein